MVCSITLEIVTDRHGRAVAVVCCLQGRERYISEAATTLMINEVGRSLPPPQFATWRLPAPALSLCVSDWLADLDRVRNPNA